MRRAGESYPVTRQRLGAVNGRGLKASQATSPAISLIRSGLSVSIGAAAAGRQVAPGPMSTLLSIGRLR